MSWYVLHCRNGQEEAIIHSCRKHLSEKATEDIFCFSHERIKKYLGKWHREVSPMFPGYVFFQSSCPELLSEELEAYREIADILEQEKKLLPVRPKEEQCLTMLCGPKHHLELSRVSVQDRKIEVLDGPLSQREDMVLKWDLHKRVAVLDCRITADGKNIWAGIDIMTDVLPNGTGSAG